jgi:aldehyde:ferredoxin oxidoreductase
MLLSIFYKIFAGVIFMPYGYNGKILHVNLTQGTWEIEEPNENWYRTYVGGSALAAYYLLKHVKPGIDALSPDNVLVFALSAVLGAPVSGFNRYSIAAKSPLTGAIGRTEAGGYFGPELKFAGFDAVIIYGKAEKPVYLWIHDGEVEIRDATSVWGKDNLQTLEILEEELKDKRIRLASIGQAGEQMLPIACVQNDLEHFNGRTGMGSVMGSKNLKAVVARGKKKMEMADPEAVKSIRKEHNAKIKVHPPNVGLNKAGTTGLLKGLNELGILPTHNFRDGTFKGTDKINSDVYHSTIFESTGTCYSCSVRCKRKVSLEDDTYPLSIKLGGAEFETLAAFGSLCEIDNLPAIARANQLCNFYGLDTISIGCIVAFAMECFEHSILTTEDTGGQEINFGDADVLIWLIEEIAANRGIGRVLGQGVKRAAEEIGKGAEEYAFHIKGQELPLHDGRGKTGMAMGFALAPTGGEHVECPHDVAFTGNDVSKLSAVGILDPVDPLKTDAAKARFFSVGQKVWQINNCYGICNFCSVPIHALTFHQLVDMIRAITGWDTSLQDILQVSERGTVMQRMFNYREGFGRDDDRVISRWHEPLPDGALKGTRIDPDEFREAMDLYYEISGWDKNGKPTRAKLIELNLGWLVEETVA